MNSTLTQSELNLIEKCYENEESFLFFLELLKRMNITIKKPSLFSIEDDDKKNRKVAEINDTSYDFLKIFEEIRHSRDLSKFSEANKVRDLKSYHFFNLKDVVLESSAFTKEALENIDSISCFYVSQDFLNELNASKQTTANRFLFICVPKNLDPEVQSSALLSNINIIDKELSKRTAITLEQLDILFYKTVIDKESPKNILNYLTTLNG